MKIFITDKFLWDVYNFLERVEEVTYPIRRRRRTMRDLYPENPIIRKYKKDLTKSQFSKLIYYLKKKNYIKSKNLEGKKAIMLTDKGINKVFKSSFKMGSREIKKRKDGKWIMLIFDVPEHSKKRRELLREIIQNLGYRMFQKSVWITPYDVFEKTEKFLQFYSLDQYVRILLVEKL